MSDAYRALRSQCRTDAQRLALGLPLFSAGDHSHSTGRRQWPNARHSWSRAPWAASS